MPPSSISREVPMRRSPKRWVVTGVDVVGDLVGGGRALGVEGEGLLLALEKG